jgi:hypothetical protein
MATVRARQCLSGCKCTTARFTHSTNCNRLSATYSAPMTSRVSLPCFMAAKLAEINQTACSSRTTRTSPITCSSCVTTTWSVWASSQARAFLSSPSFLLLILVPPNSLTCHVPRSPATAATSARPRRIRLQLRRCCCRVGLQLCANGCACPYLNATVNVAATAHSCC